MMTLRICSHRFSSTCNLICRIPVYCFILTRPHVAASKGVGATGAECCRCKL